MTDAQRDELSEPLLGEWACLGALYDEPSHGWAVARRLRPDGDVGRVWHLSRPLTYRSLDLLGRRGWVRAVAEEPGDAGPNRVILAATRSGRHRFRTWVATPVDHLRDLRSELLLKLVLAEDNGIDVTSMLAAQRELVDARVESLAERVEASGDVVERWRLESARGAQRFLAATGPDRPRPATRAR